MSDGMIFILHAVADEEYAAALAAALAPATAITSALTEEDGARGVQLGGGAASLLIWSSNTNAEAALAALPYAVAICSLHGTRVPEVLRARALRVVEVVGEPAQDAAQLREAMAELQAHLRARSLDNSRRRGSIAPRLGGVPVSAQVGDSRKPLFVRSAVGLGATLAVVGVVAPSITNRAQATNITPENASESSAAPGAMLAAAPVEVQQAVGEDVVDDPLMMLTTYSEPIVAAQAAPLSPYSPEPLSLIERYESIEPLATIIADDLPLLGETRVLIALESKQPAAQLASVVVLPKGQDASHLLAPTAAD